MAAGLSEKFKEIILNKKYLFHLHTSYTDGKCTVDDYCKWAVDHDFEVLILPNTLENPSYDFNMFLADIHRPGAAILAWLFGQVWKLKFCLEGNWIFPEVASMVPVICFACHSFRETEIISKITAESLLFI